MFPELSLLSTKHLNGNSDSLSKKKRRKAMIPSLKYEGLMED